MALFPMDRAKLDVQVESRKATFPPWWFSLFCYLGLSIISGALQRPIGGDNLEGAMTDVVTVESNAAMAVIGAVFYAVTAFLLFRFKRRVLLLTELTPLFLICALSLFSFAWSATPGGTLSKAAGLIGCTAFAVLFASLGSLDFGFKVLVRFFCSFIIVSFLVSILLPSYSYHDSNDFYAIHDGLLKATYNHKNSFARVLSLGLIVLVSLRSYGMRSSFYHWGIVTLGFYLLTQTGSAKTFVSVPLAIGVGYVLAGARRGGGRGGLVFLVLFSWVFMTASGLADELLFAVLQGLDRDPTLSARTLIWAVAIMSGLDSPVLGGGFGGGAWAGGIGDAIFRATGFDPGHSHNGFIQTFVELGLLGLALVVYFLVKQVRLIFQVSAKGNPAAYRLVVAWFVLFMVNNFAGSFLVQANDIYWFMVVFSVYVIRYLKAGKAGSMRAAN